MPNTVAGNGVPINDEGLFNISPTHGRSSNRLNVNRAGAYFCRKQPMNRKGLVLCALMVCCSLRSYAKGGTGTNAVVYDAAARGDLVKLKGYFAANTNLISLRNSLLRTAAVHGQPEAVEFLVSQEADVNDKGFFEMMPLAAVAESLGPLGFRDPEHDEKCAEVATVLLAHGANVDAMDDYKETPLLHAVEFEKNS